MALAAVSLACRDIEGVLRKRYLVAKSIKATKQQTVSGTGKRPITVLLLSMQPSMHGNKRLGRWSFLFCSLGWAASKVVASKRLLAHVTKKFQGGQKLGVEQPDFAKSS